eukprot:TRINITY_DN5573_c0_g1_i1.p1 TRINITY_DN5573_c0_g1~~TRINITY_DN5573_c0_g1_i1.p1  ORF type:complete len:453 (+),score=75.26 TRINITY_DN5573_c0_g1_i1:58-1359(+)
MGERGQVPVNGDPFVVKACFESTGEIRRFNCSDPSFEQLTSQVRIAFGLPADELLPVVKYHDDEGDLVTISSDVELKDAIEMGVSSSPPSKRILRLTLSASPDNGVTATPPSTPDIEVAKPPGRSSLTKSSSDFSLRLGPSSMPMPCANQNLRKSLGGPPQSRRSRKGSNIMGQGGGGDRTPNKERTTNHNTQVEDVPQQRSRRNSFGNEGDQQPWRKAPLGNKGLRRTYDERPKARQPHYQGQTKLIARFVKDVTVEDRTQVEANTLFMKTWRLRNEGTRPWPLGCKLVYVGKNEVDRMGGPEKVLVKRGVNPGEEVDVTAQLVAPPVTGLYTGYWKMCQPCGKKFGQRVWIQIQVIEDEGDDDSDEEELSHEDIQRWGSMLKQLEAMGFHERAANVELLERHGGNFTKVVSTLVYNNLDRIVEGEEEDDEG